MKWTQQLHDKLAEHEMAAPEGLWADIESALQQQSKPPVVGNVSERHSNAGPVVGNAPERYSNAVKSRFVALHRWAVAASLAALLLGGGYQWWNQHEELPMTYNKVQPTTDNKELPTANSEEQLTAHGEEESSKEPLTAQHVHSISYRSNHVSAAKGQADASHSEERNQVTAIEEKETATSETPADTETSTTQPTTTTATMKSEHHTATEHTYRQNKEATFKNTKHPMSLSLYAMNGMGAQTSSNGVLMAESMAKSFMDTYENSYTSSRSDGSIYLTGYEERQHHYQPITYGVTLSYPLTERLSLTSGVVYTKLSSDFTQMMRGQHTSQEQTLHYIGIPVGLNYRLWKYKGFKTYLATSAKADWNVATHLEAEGVSQELPKDHLQWSFGSSLGLEYDFVPQVGLYVEPGLSWYPDNGSHLQNYFKDKPLTFSLQLGVRLVLR